MTKALSFGEILWDIIEGSAYIGGAPFNVAAHLGKMGIRSAIVSSVGLDKLGGDALSAAQRFGVETKYISRKADLPTGTVEVTVGAGGKPDYVIRQGVAWDFISLDDSQAESLAAEPWDFLCFGTLAQRTELNRALLARVAQAARPTHVLYDVNLRQRWYEKPWIEESLRLCNILKLNGDEADVLAEMFFGKTMEVALFAETISKAYNIPVVCVTLGEEGAAIHDRGTNAWVPGTSVNVVDSVGAGDAFGAAFIFSMLNGKTPVEATNFACRMGAWVAGRRGAIPSYSDDIERQLERIRTGTPVRQ